MPKLNILHICDKFGADGSTTHGASRLFEWWIPRFNKDKYNITICGLRPADKASERLQSLGIDVICISANKYNPAILISILKIIKQKKIDALHVHGFGATNFGRIASIIKNIPLIIHEHACLPGVPCYQMIIDKILSPVVYKAVAVSESVKGFLINVRKINPDKIIVIYNGTPLENFQQPDAERIKNERRIWNIPDNNYIIGMVGRLHLQKGHEYLFRAARIILEKNTNVTFLVVGDGMLAQQLRKMCIDLKIDKNVMFTGHQENMSIIISLFDIQVFPSLWEGTPLTLFEAMAMGKPIIASSVDGLKEVLSNNKTGILVEPQNYQKLASAIINLLQDENERIELGQNAKTESAKYDIKHTVSKIEQIYDELLSICKKNI